MPRSLRWIVCVSMLVSALVVAEEPTALSWQGRDKNDLIQTFARPQYVIPGTRGGELLVYVPVDSRTMSAPSIPGGAVHTLADLKMLKAYRIFFINKEGKIDRIGSKGSAFSWSPPWWW